MTYKICANKYKQKVAKVHKIVKLSLFRIVSSWWTDWISCLVPPLNESSDFIFGILIFKSVQVCAMRDLANKMAELKFEAPLAKFEETDEWGPVDYQSSNATLKAAISDALNLNLKENDNLYLLEEAIKGSCNNTNKDTNKNDSGKTAAELKSDALNCNNLAKDHGDNFADAFSGSLEDLVNTFDEKITKCFGNYEQSVEELAPVQVRSQEEIMNECQ